jgi:YegS/Rv2252/BmrU family lipid kinase
VIARRASRSRRIRRALARADRRLLTGAIRHRTPASSRVMTTASHVANRSMLWMAISALLSATGRRKPRTAAASGLLGIGVAATLVNGPLKFAWRRDRPPIMVSGRGGEPLLPLPRTFSFPSGHSASAAAFATGASIAAPALAPVLVPMAGTVAYSRVHTGVHYPSDVAVGIAIGSGSGYLAARAVRRMRERSVHHVDGPALDIAVPRHAVVLASESAGDASDFDGARRALEDAGWSIDKVFGLDELDELAALLGDPDDQPLVVAAGGDGTVCAATNAIGKTGALLAIAPLGTSNDVARSLGIPPDPIDAVDVIANGRVCEVDAGLVHVEGEQDPRSFLHAATAGLNVEFAKMATNPSLRERFGALTYPIAAARAARSYEPFECTLEYPGHRETLSAVHLSVSCTPVFGGMLGMRVPGASMTDGLLDVIVVERLSLTRLALAVADTYIGQHRPVHRVHAMKVPEIRISAPGGCPITLDGELIGELPARFEAVPRGVRVVVPRA